MAPQPLLLAILFLSAAASASARHHLSIATAIAGLSLTHHLPHKHHHKHASPPPASSPAPSPASPLPNAPQAPSLLNNIPDVNYLSDVLGGLGLPPVTSPAMSIDSIGLGKIIEGVSNSMSPMTSPGELVGSGALVGQLLGDLSGSMPPVSSSENNTQALTDEASKGLGKLFENSSGSNVGAAPEATAAESKSGNSDEGGELSAASSSSSSSFSAIVKLQSSGMAAVLVSMSLFGFLL